MSRYAVKQRLDPLFVMLDGFYLETLFFINKELLEFHYFLRLTQGGFAFFLDLVIPQIHPHQIAEQRQKLGQSLGPLIGNIVVPQIEVDKTEKIVGDSD